MLPGGPGQDVSTLEDHVNKIVKFLDTPISIYLMDQRGVGKSQSFGNPYDMSWLNEVDNVNKASIIPLGEINLSNAARDVIILARSIKLSPDFEKGAATSLYGVSFGGNWAYRTIQLAPEEFDSGIFDSMLVYDGHFSIHNDDKLIQNCNSHPYCKAQFGGDANKLRSMLTDIMNPAFNKCSAQLVAHLNNANKFHRWPLRPT